MSLSYKLRARRCETPHKFLSEGYQCRWVRIILVILVVVTLLLNELIISVECSWCSDKKTSRQRTLSSSSRHPFPVATRRGMERSPAEETPSRPTTLSDSRWGSRVFLLPQTWFFCFDFGGRRRRCGYHLRCPPPSPPCVEVVVDSAVCFPSCTLAINPTVHRQFCGGPRSSFSSMSF